MTFTLRCIGIWTACSIVVVDSFTSFNRLVPSASTVLSAKTTLSEETTWNLRFVLTGIKTASGRQVDEIFSVGAHFVEEEGYEPPQGKVVQLNEDSRLQILKSRWQLSEDPNDRKDGLWVWGLFKEPLYPYMLLTLETDKIKVQDADDGEADFIEPLQLYAQINHKRDSEAGVILEGTELSARSVETLKADVFGAATVDINKDVGIGTISIQPRP